MPIMCFEPGAEPVETLKAAQDRAASLRADLEALREKAGATYRAWAESGNWRVPFAIADDLRCELDKPSGASLTAEIERLTRERTEAHEDIDRTHEILAGQDIPDGSIWERVEDLVDRETIVREKMHDTALIADAWKALAKAYAKDIDGTGSIVATRAALEALRALGVDQEAK